MLLGIDIGGTTIKAGSITPEGKLFGTCTIATPKEMETAATQSVADALYAFVSEQDGGADSLDAIGIAVPGIVDADNTVHMTPNVKIDLPLLMDALQKRFPQAYIAALNDANAAALGEQKCGAGDKSPHMVFITLGTGVGGGIIVDDQLVIGRCGGAGEIGHITVEPGGHACGCGRQGCLELYCSSRGLVRLYKEAYEEAAATAKAEALQFQHDAEAKPVFDAARFGDPIAQKAIHVMSGYLASSLATIACILACHSFVIGGGLSGGFDLFRDDLIAQYKALALPAQADIIIRQAELGNKAGMLGAAFYALEKHCAYKK